MTSADDINRKLVYRFTEECWNGGDLAKVAELVAEDCRYHDAVFRHMAPGPAGMRLLIERVRRAFPDLKFTILDSICTKDEVEVHWSASATQAAEFLGIPTTEKFASIMGTSVYRIEGGKIVENRVKWDVMSLMAQLRDAAATGPEAKKRRLRR